MSSTTQKVDSMSSMTMNASQTGSTSSMDFHAGVGDTLWFQHFVPSNAATMFGACILLFFVAILSRSIDAFSRFLIGKWNKDATFKQQSRSITPFIFKNDMARGVLYLVQAGFSYLLMLAVMTYNGYFFISVLIGLGVGETLFGRFNRTSGIDSDQDSSTALHSRKASQEYPLLDTELNLGQHAHSPISMKEVTSPREG